MIEDNLRCALKTWGDPITREQLDASKRRFLESVKEKPAPSRFVGIATVAASLLIAVAVFRAVVSFRQNPVPGGGQEVASPVQDDLELWIRQLGADDIVTRGKAVEELKSKGGRALPALRAALERAKDPEIRGRLQEVIEALNQTRLILAEQPAIPGGNLAWSPDGRSLAIVLGKGLKVYDTRSWKVQQSSVLDGRTSCQVAWHPSGRWIFVLMYSADPVAAIPDRLIGVDARDLSKAALVGNVRWTLGIGGFLDGERVVFATPSESILGAQLKVAAPGLAGWEARDACSTEMALHGTAASPDGKWLALVGERLEIIDPQTWTKMATVDLATLGSIMSIRAPNPVVAFSPDSRQILVKGSVGMLGAYETSTWKPLGSWQPHGTDVGMFGFTHDSRHIITTGVRSPTSDLKLRAWRARDRRELAAVDLPPFAYVAVSPVDDRIATSFLGHPQAEKYTVQIYRLDGPGK